jgi:hypothetical protein
LRLKAINLEKGGLFMKIANKFYLSLLIISTIALVAGIILSRAMTSGKANHSNHMNSKNQGQRDLPRDPCWFIDLKDKSVPHEVLMKRQDQKMRGYSEDIPLSEAIRIFNEEKQCVNALASYPPLTEDELIAAIVAGPDNILTEDARRFQEDILWKIVTQKVMPKGTLLVATTGPRVQESPLRPEGTVKAVGISIALHLGLENHEYGQILKPEQRFVIRRTYFKVETIR